MRKTALFSLFLCAVLLFSACTAGGDALPYNTGGECAHVFGVWYDITPATCQSEGEQVRYCKRCREAELFTVTVPADEAARAHSFTDTVTPATEAAGGFTDRECSLCHYRVEGVFPTPPLYALLTDSSTNTTPVSGVNALLLTDTATHVLHRAAATDTAAAAAPALRLATALTALSAISAEGSTLTLDTETVITQALLDSLPTGAPRAGFVAGNRVTVSTLISAVAATGGSDAALALATVVAGSEQAFLPLMRARVAALGLTHTVIGSLLDTAAASTTLYDTAVLLARALDEPLLADALAAGVGQYVKILDRTPAVWLSADALRISALSDGKGGYYFLLVCGNALPATVEETLFAPYF